MDICKDGEQVRVPDEKDNSQYSGASGKQNVSDLLIELFDKTKRQDSGSDQRCHRCGEMIILTEPHDICVRCGAKINKAPEEER